MKRSIPIAAALLCALGQAQPAAGGWNESSSTRAAPSSLHLLSRGYDDALRALQIAERRLRDAERTYSDARCRLDALLAEQSAVRRELADVERQLAECRNLGHEHEIRRLERDLEDASRRAATMEADVARFRNQAATASHAAEAARADYFRQAECAPVILEATERIRLGEAALASARSHAALRARDSGEWRYAAYQRDDAKQRLERGRWHGISGREADRLRQAVDDAERHMNELENAAVGCDPDAIDAEVRLAAAKRAYDEVWACVERDLLHDRVYAAALSDARRFEHDAARADQALCDTRGVVAGLERDLDRLRGAFHVTNFAGLERQAFALRDRLARLDRDVCTAQECLRQAEWDVGNARAAHAAAVSALERCREERPRYVPQPAPRHDGRGGSQRDDHRDDRDHEARENDDRHGTYRDRGERYDRARGGDDRKRKRD